jgi:hypothetical protein
MIIRVQTGISLPCLMWEIYYKAGHIITSKDMPWAEAPADDVLGVIWWHGLHMKGVRKKTFSHGKDYYIYENRNLWGDTDNYDEVKEYKYKRGVWTTDEHMAQVHRIIFEKLNWDG